MSGAHIKVIKSKNKLNEGIEGIIARETMRTWILITQEN